MSITFQPLAESKTYDGKAFPLACTPSEPKAVSWQQLAAYLSNNRAEFMQKVTDYGCVVIRGFDLESPEEMTAVADGLGLYHMPYLGGAAVRTAVVSVSGACGKKLALQRH